ncbi:MAG: endonuclease IV [Candidatus Syntrophoarchaeum sp. GoM_oil]|nr:MAG: endonuclease IV [Candidatus Syntrophoarchaeum sp. GoM_oil]
MNKIGFSSLLVTNDPFEWVWKLEDIGFEVWEVVDEGEHRIESIRDGIREIYETTNLEITSHAPFSDLNIASVNYPIWSETIRQIKRCIDLMSEFVEVVTVHPGALSPLGMQIPDTVREQVIAGFTEICDHASQYGIMIGLENMIEIEMLLARTPEEVVGIIENVGRDNIAITWDVGHSNTTGTIDGFLAIRDRIKHIHIHDNHGRRDEHLPVGAGTIDWKHVMEGLEGYNGRMIIEARSLQDGEEGLRYIEGII